MKMRQHHNNKGFRQIKTGRTRTDVKKIASNLGLIYGKREMKFDIWLKTVCFKKPTKEAEDLARMAWNDAIQQAEVIISDKYDEQEPWLEPGDITKSLCDT